MIGVVVVVARGKRGIPPGASPSVPKLLAQGLVFDHGFPLFRLSLTIPANHLAHVDDLSWIKKQGHSSTDDRFNAACCLFASRATNVSMLDSM